MDRLLNSYHEDLCAVKRKLEMNIEEASCGDLSKSKHTPKVTLLL